MTDAPLKGMSLAREAGRLLSWDEGDQLYLMSLAGETLAVQRMPSKVVAAEISDDGTLVAVIGGGSRIWLLGPDLELIEDRSVITDPTALAIDPHGRFIAVASKMNMVQFYTRYGKLSGKMETRQPLSGLEFVPDRLAMVGLGAYSMLMGFELSIDGESGKLGGDLVWTQNLLSSAGRMSVTGDGGAILVACYTHGVQRFDGGGKSEGTYHLDGSATLSEPDFAGRTMAVATMEGTLSILGGSGNVKWKTGLGAGPVGLEMDALGRFVLVGLPSGEITHIDLFGGGNPPGASGDVTGRGKVTVRTTSGTVRPPDWSAEVVKLEDQSEYTVLAVLDDPPRIAVIGPTNKMELFTTSGKRLGQAPGMSGVGRIIRTAPGWIVAATDRMIVACDCRKNTGQRVDLSLVQVTHLVISPDDYGLAIVQERDRIGRATLAGRWVWKCELKLPVEDMAIGPEASMALTLEDGTLSVYDAAGNPTEAYRSSSSEPHLLTSAPTASPPGVAWLTLARRAQILRGHDLRGRVLWESPVPFEAWQMHPVGAFVVITAPDGRSVAYDGGGHARGQSRAEGPLDLYAPSHQGSPLRISRQGQNLICSSMDGQVAWRAVGSVPYGPIGVGAAGVAVMAGKNVNFFGASGSK